ncbi:MAG TPA: nucleoside triphosphate pyrophosphohydrolase [Chloroflexota bacterium]|nr:nucleoside triphosphate pyrophosphohydrolase [Chloroflexota bacterium]
MNDRPEEGPRRLSVVGLGPGDWSQVTLGVYERLQAAGVIYLRTQVHPTVQGLRERLGSAPEWRSFDHLYDRAVDFAELYQEIAEAVLAAVRAEDRSVVYAVPGHPLMGERSVALLLERGQAAGIEVDVLDGLSFLEPVARALALDPVASGVQLVDGAALGEPAAEISAANWSGLSPRVISTGRPILIAQVYNRRVASACKLWLLERYPETHPIRVVRAAGTSLSRVWDTGLAELDHTEGFDHLTTLYVPPLDPLADSRGLATLPYLTARLRAEDGCPWDRKQTLHSLKGHLLEEAYEAVAAIDEEDPQAMAEELGDVLLLVSMLARIGEEEGSFDFPTVLEAVTTKLIRRHPHVFGDLSLETAGAVLVNWERMKVEEKRPEESALSGVPLAMPALIASQSMQRKAAALGFEWESVAGVYAKIDEELREVQEAGEADRLEEVGDLLFVIVSLCRHLGLDADEALRKANAKFRRRFGAVERLGVERGMTLASLDPRGLDALWSEVKAAE